MENTSTMTITEALAEVATLKARRQKKLENLLKMLIRPSKMIDPLHHEGGSSEYCERQLQGIMDIGKRIIDIRQAINAINSATELDVKGIKMTVAEWLVWKREVAPFGAAMNESIANKIERERTKGRYNEEEARDVIVNINEFVHFSNLAFIVMICFVENQKYRYAISLCRSQVAIDKGGCCYRII